MSILGKMWKLTVDPGAIRFLQLHEAVDRARLKAECKLAACSLANRVRETKGEAPAYDEKYFLDIWDEFDEGYREAKREYEKALAGAR